MNEYMHRTSSISRTGDGRLLRRDVLDGCWGQHGCLDAPDYIAAGAMASIGVTQVRAVLVIKRGR
jgi:hypothetical protein